MPSASVRGGTFQALRSRSTSGQLGMLPMISARPVSRKGGRCERVVPSEASVAHRAMAARARSVGDIASSLCGAVVAQHR
jgi:hypothetical protein